MYYLTLLIITDKKLYNLCVEYGAKARMWKKKFVALLPEVARRGIHKKKGFATIVEFAAKVGGVSKSTVEAVFRVQNHVQDKPALQKILSKVGVDKVRVVATIATKENQEELAEKVKTMSKAALELFAKSQRDEIRPGTDREYIGFHVDKEVALELKKFKQKLGTVEWNDVIKALLEKTKEEPKKTRKSTKIKITRTPSVQEKREAYEEHNGKCAFPGCNEPATELHHPDRYALNKSHKRLTPLCKTHHEIAHHGLIGNEEREANTWFIKERANKSNKKFEIDRKVIQFRQASLAM